MNFIKFLTSKTFVIQLLIFFVLVFLFIFGFLRWANYYTLHGKEIKVPDLSGYSLSEVEDILQKLELKFVVLDSSEYYPDKPIFSVLSQYPAPEALVKPGKIIKLTINPSGPRLVKVPNLVERSRKRAVYDLESKGFKVGKITFIPYIGKDMVVAAQHMGRELTSNDYLPKGSVIDLVVGMDLDSELLEVPYLLGKNFTTARQILSQLGLNIGYLNIEPGTDTSRAFVYRQEPMPTIKKTIFKGSEISIWLTSDYNKMPMDSLSYFSIQQNHEEMDF
jgi:beta-lactam-binding protein with PASTA domain